MPHGLAALDPELCASDINNVTDTCMAAVMVVVMDLPVLHLVVHAQEPGDAAAADHLVLSKMRLHA